MTHRTRVYLHGMLQAIINSVANAVLVIIVDPATFNLQSGLPKVLMFGGVSAIIALFTYLKEHPLPDIDDVDFREAKQQIVERAVSAGTGDGGIK